MPSAILEAIDLLTKAYSVCAVYHWDAASPSLNPLFFRSAATSDVREFERSLNGISLDGQSGLLQRVQETGQPVFHPEIEATCHQGTASVSSEALGIQSLIAVPIPTNGESAGVFVAASLNGDPPLTEDDYQAAQALATVLGRWYAGERFREEAEQREESQKRLQQISRAISRTLDLNGVLRMIRDAVVETLGFDRAGVFVVDPQAGGIRGVCGTDANGSPIDISDQFFPLDDPDHFGQLYRREIPHYLVPELCFVDLHTQTGAPLKGAHGCMPFIANEDVVGILAVDNSLTGRPITEVDLERISPFCDEAAVAIRNARLHEELNRRIESLSTLHDIGVEVRATMEPDTVIKTLVLRVQEISGITDCSVYLSEPKGEELKWRHSVRNGQVITRPEALHLPENLLPSEAPLAFRCLNEEQAFLFHAEAAGLSPTEEEWVRRENVTAGVLLPIVANGEKFGILALIQHDRKRLFDRDEIAFFQSLANHAAVALYKARLYYEADRALQRTREINAYLRKAFVPDLPKSAPGLDIGSVFEPASHETRLGGDFYDLFQIGRNQIGFVMGDVAGHDLDAAMQTAAVKYLLRAFTDRSRSTANVVRRVNEALMNQFFTPMFISLFYGVVDLKKGTLCYTNAGHEPPQLLLPGEDLPQLLDNTDYLLAVKNEVPYHQHQADFPVGSSLVLYTDGITEARQGDEFLLTEGVSRLLQEKRAESDAQTLANGLWESVRDYADRLNDDVALLVLRRTE